MPTQALTDDEVRELAAALDRAGYALVRAGVTKARCDAANDAVEEFKRRNRREVAANLGTYGELRRVADLHEVVRALATLFSENRALALCDHFFGEETALYTSLYFEHGSEQALHRDSPLFTTKPAGRYLGVWVALDDVDERNGALVVVPGSHALPDIDVEAIAIKRYGDPSLAPAHDDAAWNEYQETVAVLAESQGLTAREVHLGRGDVIVWHPLMLHGGAPHRVHERPRRSVVFHVTPVATAVFHQDVFFDANRDVSTVPPWTYSRHEGRLIADHGIVDFAHEYIRPKSALVRPDAHVIERFGAKMRKRLARVRSRAGRSR